ncbi:cytochrome c oxidase subunit Vb protein [Rutstroemia sp. NJR-2017a BVV2]|nr:cytochrome c oxidase subunit Vb protein [Rutstroemia sp. NJR-2017a BVV2]PQE21844.1 cytochrome c oxidase subunit Vb protein [Rutstroemia sp. NJR-2017a BVV2]
MEIKDELDHQPLHVICDDTNSADSSPTKPPLTHLTSGITAVNLKNTKDEIVRPHLPSTDDQLTPPPTMFLQRSAIAAARRVAVTPAVRRSFATSMVRRTSPPPQPKLDLETGGVDTEPWDHWKGDVGLPGGASKTQIKKFEAQLNRTWMGLISRTLEIKNEADLVGPGAAPGTIPTDYEQATGLERLEILGKMQGVDVFDMKPLDSSRKGTDGVSISLEEGDVMGRNESGRTLDNPIIVKSYGDEQYAGCTGYPVDSHITIWLAMSRDRPVERCPECGNVLKMEYVGPTEDVHDHHHEAHPDGHHNFEEPKTFADFVKPEYR